MHNTNVTLPRVLPPTGSALPDGTIKPHEAMQALAAGKIGRHAIENDDLYELVTYGDELAKKTTGLGNWNQGNAALCAAMTHLARRAFDIHRLPWHPDLSETNMPSDCRRVLRFLQDAHRVEAAREALLALHQHCQRTLKALGTTHVRLRRALCDFDERSETNGGFRSHGYATRVVVMAHCAKQLKEGYFALPVNILSSWSEGGYSMPVVIERDVPIADIGWVADLIQSRSSSFTHAAERSEWVVLNQAGDGRVLFAPEAVVKAGIEVSGMQKWTENRLKNELRQGEETYGQCSTMFFDVPTLPGRLRVGARAKLALDVLRGRVR